MVQVHSAGALTIPLRAISGDRWEVSGLDASDSLAALLERIAAVAGVPVGEQRLLLGDEAVPTRDPRASLSSLGLGGGAVCTLVRVGVPHSGRYGGIASYAVAELQDPRQSFEVWFDCSTWRWLDVARGLMEFELVYRVLKSASGDADPYVGCVGAEVFEGVYDWEEDAIQAKGVFLHAVPQEAATPRPPSSPLTLSAAAAERAARPWWVHLSREELCGELLRRLDSDGDGRLRSSELWALAGRLGCEHGGEEWEEEYLAACELCGAQPEAGLDAAQLLVFVDVTTEPAGFVDLAGLLEELDADAAAAAAASEGRQGPTSAPVSSFLSRTPSLRLTFESGGRRVRCCDDLASYVVERLE